MRSFESVSVLEEFMFFIDIFVLSVYNPIGNELDVSSKATKDIRCTYCRKFIFILHIYSNISRKTITDWALDRGLKHPRNDNFVDFDYGKVLFVSRNEKCEAAVVVGITDKGDAVFYGIVNIRNVAFDLEQTELPTNVTTIKSPDAVHGNSVSNTLSQDNPVVNGM